MTKKTFRGHFLSSRFVIVQEVFILAAFGAVARTIWAAFPLLEFYGVLTPIVLGILGLKTWNDVQDRKEETKETLHEF